MDPFVTIFGKGKINFHILPIFERKDEIVNLNSPRIFALVSMNVEESQEMFVTKLTFVLFESVLYARENST